jgi:hypothetical protein
MIGERLFVRDFGIDDGFELWPFRRKFRELERAPFAKADEAGEQLFAPRLRRFRISNCSVSL